MTKSSNGDRAQETPMGTKTAKQRRALLKRLGRFAAVTAPTVTLLLAAQVKPGGAVLPSCKTCSSKARKTPVGGINTSAILAAVAALPVDTWRYKPETGLDQRSHIGPYAEDFKTAFGVGDGVTISTIDAVGVCLAAIKALSQKVESLEAELRAAGRKELARRTKAARRGKTVRRKKAA